MDRREFLKTSTKFIFTGAVFVPITGILRPSISNSFWAHQTMISSGGAPDWAGWNEASEGSLAFNNIHTVMAEGGANTDEIGKGSIQSGTDLVWTQNGGIAGVVSGFRDCPANDYFSPTQPLIDEIFKDTSTYSIILKLKDWQYSGGASTDYVLNFTSAANDIIAFQRNKLAPQKFRGYWHVAGVEKLNTSTVDDCANNITVYLYAFHTGSTLYMGFNTTRPTKLSDITGDANKYVSVAFPGTMAGSFTTTRNIMGSVNGDAWFAYCVISSACLIDLTL